MAEISKIRLPSGNEYEIKDAVARSMISGGVSFIVAWDGASTPVPANIPAGVTVTYNDTTYTGTLSAASAQAGAFYLVKSSTQKGGTLDVYDEYVPIGSGTKTWEKIGDTQLDLSDLGTLAYKDTVTLNKGAAVKVLGNDTTVTNSSSAVSFAAHTTDKVLGSDATFTTTVTPSTTNIKATASGTAVGANGTAAAITGFGSHTTKSALGANATFTTSVTPTTTNIKATADSTSVNVGDSDTVDAVLSYPGVTQKLNRTSYTVITGNTDVSIPNVTGNTDVSIPNVTSAGSASTWGFAMGTGTDAETLIISGGNSVAPTLGTALSASKVTLGTALSASKVTSQSKYVLDGTFTTTSGNTGPEVLTGLGTPTTRPVLDGDEDAAVNVYAPKVELSTGATAGDGVISVATGISSATTTSNSKDAVTAITALGTPTTANALTGVKVTTQPTIALATGATAGTGVISVATGISSASTTTNSKDEVTAITALGAATAAAQTATVGSNDEVSIAAYDQLSVSVS